MHVDAWTHPRLLLHLVLLLGNSSFAFLFCILNLHLLFVGSVPPPIWLPLSLMRTTWSVYYSIHVIVILSHYVIALECSPVQRKGLLAWQRFALKLNLSRALWRNRRLLCPSTCLIYIIINKPLIYIMDRENVDWFDENDDVFTYVFCLFKIEFINQHSYFCPEPLLKRRHPQTRGWWRHLLNPKGLLQRSHLKETLNRISMTVSHLNRVIKLQERRLWRLSCGLKRTVMTKHSCLRLKRLALGIPTTTLLKLRRTWGIRPLGITLSYYIYYIY